MNIIEHLNIRKGAIGRIQNKIPENSQESQKTFMQYFF